jgi:hypothetical protein
LAGRLVDIMQSTGAVGKRPPTRHACRAWLVDDGSRIAVAYRVDGN